MAAAVGGSRGGYRGEARVAVAPPPPPPPPGGGGGGDGAHWATYIEVL